MDANVKEQIDDLLAHYSGLRAVALPEGSFRLGGIVRLDAENDGRDYLVRDFPVRVEIDADYPISTPKVWVEDESLLTGYEHVFADGSLCLGVFGELALLRQSDSSLTRFMDDIVIGNLYAVEYHRIFGEMPSGERRHGSDGIIEAYQELFGVDDPCAAMRLLAVACGIEDYRGHANCPCGSGVRTRDCHGDILMKFIKGFSRVVAKGDFYSIVKERLIIQKQKEDQEQRLSILRERMGLK